MSRSWIAAASCAVVGCVFATNARAAQVVIDFNDLANGQLSGQAGGSGTTGTWAASTNPQVVAGDLTAPAATHYALAQSAGTPQAIRTSAASSNADGQSTRPLDGTLGGTVWFSFLVNPNDSGARAGVSFNASGASAGGARVDAVGTQLFVSYGSTSGTFVPSAMTTGAAHLVVGQVLVNEDGGTNERLRLWVDPDVATLTQDTTAQRFFDGTGSNWVGDGITSVAIQSYGGAGGGTVDAIRVSNDPTAQSDVTGFGAPVPEPTSLALCAIAATSLLRRRRRHAR